MSWGPRARYFGSFAFRFLLPWPPGARNLLIKQILGRQFKVVFINPYFQFVHKFTEATFERRPRFFSDEGVSGPKYSQPVDATGTRDANRIRKTSWTVRDSDHAAILILDEPETVADAES